jgi:hypothetical protein
MTIVKNLGIPLTHGRFRFQPGNYECNILWFNFNASHIISLLEKQKEEGNDILCSQVKHSPPSGPVLTERLLH